MSLDTSSVPELSAQQRRCNLLLMLYAPLPAVQLEKVSQINGVDLKTTQQDVAQLSLDIQRLHQLEIVTSHDHHCRLQGGLLNQRLCLIQYLRRAIRSNPNFIHQHFTPLFTRHLAQTADFDSSRYDRQFPTLITTISRQLHREFSSRDEQFLHIYLQYCLWQNLEIPQLQLSDSQQQWLRDKPEFSAASLIFSQLQKLFSKGIAECERDFFTLLLTLIKNHSYDSSGSREDQKLMHAIRELVASFQ